MSSLHNLEHLRLAGIAPPPNPNPTPAPPPSTDVVETFNFLSAPAGVTVARTGANATRRSAAATVAIMAANTLRYQYSAAGTLLGLLCEKARTNLVPAGRTPATDFATFGAGVTETANYGTAPNGATESTRIEVAAGNANSGLRYGISGVTSPYTVRLWGRSLSGAARQITLRDPTTGTYDSSTTFTLQTTWTLLELYGSVASGGFYNFDIVVPDTSALDIEIWLADLQNGTNDTGDMGTAVANGTRPKEVLTITFATGSVTRDIQVTFNNDQQQNFLNQVLGVGAAWTLDADNLNRKIIKTIVAYPQGTLAESPAPAPSPSPSPSPSPAPSNNVLTTADMIAQMKTNDEKPLYNSPASGSWQHGGIVVMGADLRYESTPTWWPANNALAQTALWTTLLPWFVVWDGNSHADNLNCRVAIRDMELWLMTTAGVWYRAAGPAAVSGSAYYRNLQGDVSGADERREADNSLSVRVQHSSDRVYHGWSSKLNNVTGIGAFQVRLRARKVLHDPTGTDQRSSAVYLLSVGCDAYPTADATTSSSSSSYIGVSWIPGCGGSRFKYVTNDWQAFILTPLETAYSVDGSPRGTRNSFHTLSDAELTNNPPSLSY